MIMTQPPVWLITGCSSGIGEALAKEALARGELVIATARAPLDRLASLKDAGCKIMELDVGAEEETVQKAVEEALKLYGRIDVVVPNAGYIEGAFVEDCTTDSFQKQFNVNFFGVTKVVNALLPHFRSRRTGTIAFTSSVFSVAVIHACAMYAASKHAVSAYAKTIALEMAQFNVKPILFEIGYMRTAVMDKSHIAMPTSSDYNDTMAMLGPSLTTMGADMPGDPRLCAKAIVDTVHDATRQSMFVPLGSDAVDTVRAYAQALLAACDENEVKARGLDLPEPKRGFFAQVPQYFLLK